MGGGMGKSVTEEHARTCLRNKARQGAASECTGAARSRPPFGCTNPHCIVNCYHVWVHLGCSPLPVALGAFPLGQLA